MSHALSTADRSVGQVVLNYLKMPFSKDLYPGYAMWGWVLVFVGLSVFLVFVIGAYNPGLLEKGANQLEARMKADGTYLQAYSE